MTECGRVVRYGDTGAEFGEVGRCEFDGFLEIREQIVEGKTLVADSVRPFFVRTDCSTYADVNSRFAIVQTV